MEDSNDWSDFTAHLKAEAVELGFVLCGVTAAAEPPRLSSFLKWLDKGFAGEMKYLWERSAAYAHPSHVLDGCRTVVMMAFPYTPQEFSDLNPPNDRSAKVARYAQGQRDYHDVLHEKLKGLKVWLQNRQPTAKVRGVVDTAPLLEREFAQAAGLGWVGKNTLVLNRQWGSYFFLGAILTDLPLAIDPPQSQGYCGTCTACLDSCPTGAFVEPYVLDARRCLSYLTIEHRGAIDQQLREHFDDWVFGCDVCQQVCPWNRKLTYRVESDFEPQADLQSFDVLEALQLDELTFRERYRSTPLWRSKRQGIVRNAILIAGNRQLTAACAPLQSLLLDPDPVLRDAANWALARIAEHS